MSSQDASVAPVFASTMVCSLLGVLVSLEASVSTS
jgi:hypothetical protein